MIISIHEIFTVPKIYSFGAPPIDEDAWLNDGSQIPAIGKKYLNRYFM